MGDPNKDTVAGVITAIASLLSALAWPALAAIVLYGISQHAEIVASTLRRITGDSGTAKLSLSPAGVSIEIAQKSANAVIESAKKSDTGPLNAEQKSEVEKNATAAAADLSLVALDTHKRFKILWVDDHPENNIYLQYAFQVLNIIVICIDSNNGIKESFSVAGNYDLVITDMGRDEMGGFRADDRQGGLKTVEIINSEHTGIPIIIYAGNWSASHRKENLGPSVIKITNYPQELYQLVIELAKKKAASS